MAKEVQGVALVWFRRDLRLADNPALSMAVASGLKVVPVYVFDEEGEGTWPEGGASRWWLHHSLVSLEKALRDAGSHLMVRAGDTQSCLLDFAESLNASEVYWNRRYEPHVVSRDTEIKKALAERGIAARSFNGSLLHSPLNVETKSGGPFKVFTPFWKNIRPRTMREQLDRPSELPPPDSWPASEPIASLGLLPKVDWDTEFFDCWTPGEEGAQQALELFQKEPASHYKKKRDFPSEEGVSRLSPHLHFGEISPIQVWRALDEDKDEAFLRQLAWREFAHHLLYHFPDTPERSLRPEFEAFPWREDTDDLQAWQRGQTGYPIVDAGMRELWATGWMHNRVRMVAGSFLVKHLLLDWRHGARWFWDTLVDADLANNTLGWQWVAGCGADAAPYFRVFNPIIQGEKFDKAGEYTRRWVPELKGMPNKYLFRPWEAPQDVLREAGVSLGESYPRPIVDHAEGRQGALQAYDKMRENAAASD